MNFKTIDVLGIPFTCTNQSNFIFQLEKDLFENKSTFVVTANPEIVMYAKASPNFNSLLHSADYITADGIGIVKAAQFLGTPLPGRITGYDLLCSLLEVASQKNYSIYFLGAKEETLNLALKNMTNSYPNLTIAGSHHGYFEISDPTIIENIKKTQPDFIFVALGFPRQEQWIASAQKVIGGGVFIGVGGSFDVLAGTVKRAPLFWQNLHLEWLYRLIKQPTRLKRMIALPKFVYHIFKD